MENMVDLMESMVDLMESMRHCSFVAEGSHFAQQFFVHEEFSQLYEFKRQE